MTQTATEPFRTSVSSKWTVRGAGIHHPTVLAAIFQQAKADHDYVHSEREPTENTEITRNIAALTAQIKTLAEQIHGNLPPCGSTGASESEKK